METMLQILTGSPSHRSLLGTKISAGSHSDEPTERELPPTFDLGGGPEFDLGGFGNAAGRLSAGAQACENNAPKEDIDKLLRRLRIR